jgi:hypothetical protein
VDWCWWRATRARPRLLANGRDREEGLLRSRPLMAREAPPTEPMCSLPLPLPRRSPPRTKPCQPVPGARRVVPAARQFRSPASPCRCRWLVAPRTRAAAVAREAESGGGAPSERPVGPLLARPVAVARLLRPCARGACRSDTTTVAVGSRVAACCSLQRPVGETWGLARSWLVCVPVLRAGCGAARRGAPGVSICLRGDAVVALGEHRLC